MIKTTNPFAMLFNIAFPILIASLLILAVYSVNSIREMRQLIFSDFNQAHIHWQIMQLENSVATSARMAVMTGNKDWISRYNDYHAQLQSKLMLENNTSSNKPMDADFDQVAVHMKQTSALQQQAVSFLQQNNIDGARRILLGKTYETASENLRQAMDEHNQSLSFEAYSRMPDDIQSLHDTIIYFIVSLFLLLLIWATVYKSMHRLKMLGQNNQRLEELLYYARLTEIGVKPKDSDTIKPLFADMQKDRPKLIRTLKKALSDNQFVVYYQPIVSAVTGKMAGAEALIRWQHPVHGLLLPDAFLPLCEATEMIVPIGAWVFRETCLQVMKWQKMGYAKLWVSVNFSARQINHPGLFDMISAAIQDSGISPVSIRIEITESLVLHDSENTIKLLTQLRQMGFQLSLDDFGTGHSSLHYLKKFPFSSLKIDRSFIADITSNITSMAIVETTIALGRSLGLTLIAEGVEEESQLHLLKKMNCHFIQGFLFSRAVPDYEFTHLLQSRNVPLEHRQNLLIEDPARYHYTIMQAQHFEQAVNVITHTFCDYEPMTKYLGITYDDFTPFAALIVRKAIEDGLSIVALDGDTVCACTIVEDIANPLDMTIEIDPRFNIIFSLLEQLSSDFFKEKNIVKGHIAHLFITAVNATYHGQGLSIKVNFESINLARSKGYDFMCCEFTHAYNEEGTVKNLTNSRLLIKSCNYRDYIFDHKRPFMTLDGSASAYIWELKEGARLASSV